MFSGAGGAAAEGGGGPGGGGGGGAATAGAGYGGGPGGRAAAAARAQAGAGAEAGKPWHATFAPIAAEQVAVLRGGASVAGAAAVAAELREAKVGVVYRTWTDVKRAKGSCLGSNITDGQFFAVAPEAERVGRDYQAMPNSQFVPFPAVRPSNFSDEVDIETPAGVTFKAKNRDGAVETVTLAEFLRRIGHFITDLPRDADWSDGATDSGPMQSASQFSTLPCPASKTEVGIAMFGYQCKNLHVIVAPDGTLGWAPEGRGSKRIFLRGADGTTLHTVALVPEDRAEVQAGFFKPEKENETIAEEAERYKEVENQLLHIQIEMDLPQAHRPAALSGFALGGSAGSLDLLGGLDDCFLGAAPSSPPYSSAVQFLCTDPGPWTGPMDDFGDLCDLGAAPASSGGDLAKGFGGQLPTLGGAASPACPSPAAFPKKKKPAMRKKKCRSAAPKRQKKSFGAPAAAVACAPMAAVPVMASAPTADVLESASAPAPAPDPPPEEESACAEDDLNLARVQLGSRIGRAADDDAVPAGAKRAAGVGVRVTRMVYGVCADGAITAPRVRRFLKQLSFDRRARALAHGSLVTGQGSWSQAGEEAPITLPPLPKSLQELSQMFVQFPTKDVHKFVVGGADSAIKLAPGEEMAVPGVMTVKNMGGFIVASRAQQAGVAAAS